MAFGRRKENRQLDNFGPLDTLIAASQTLNDSERQIVTGLLLNESFINTAILEFGSLPPDEIDRLIVVARLGNAYAKYLIKKPTMSFSEELTESRRLVSDILECDLDQLDDTKYAEGIGLSLTAIRGGTRLLQLRREDQSLAAIAFAVPLIYFACARKT